MMQAATDTRAISDTPGPSLSGSSESQISRPWRSGPRTPMEPEQLSVEYVRTFDRPLPGWALGPAWELLRFKFANFSGPGSGRGLEKRARSGPSDPPDPHFSETSSGPDCRFFGPPKSSETGKKCKKMYTRVKHKKWVTICCNYTKKGLRNKAFSPDY